MSSEKILLIKLSSYGCCRTGGFLEPELTYFTSPSGGQAQRMRVPRTAARPRLSGLDRQTDTRRAANTGLKHVVHKSRRQELLLGRSVAWPFASPVPCSVAAAVPDFPHRDADSAGAPGSSLSQAPRRASGWNPLPGTTNTPISRSQEVKGAVTVDSSGRGRKIGRSCGTGATSPMGTEHFL